MSTFRLIISSPDGAVFDGEAVMLTVRGVEGELAVMAGHAPLVTSVKPCRCKIELADEQDEKYGELGGGLLSVTREAVTLLTGSFHWSQD